MGNWSKEQQEEFNRKVAEHDKEQQDSGNENQNFEISQEKGKDEK